MSTFTDIKRQAKTNWVLNETQKVLGEDPFLTQKEVARKLKMSPRTLKQQLEKSSTGKQKFSIEKILGIGLGADLIFKKAFGGLNEESIIEMALSQISNLVLKYPKMAPIVAGAYYLLKKIGSDTILQWIKKLGSISPIVLILIGAAILIPFLFGLLRQYFDRIVSMIYNVWGGIKDIPGDIADVAGGFIKGIGVAADDPIGFFTGNYNNQPIRCVDVIYPSFDDWWDALSDIERAEYKSKLIGFIPWAKGAMQFEKDCEAGLIIQPEKPENPIPPENENGSGSVPREILKF